LQLDEGARKTAPSAWMEACSRNTVGPTPVVQPMRIPLVSDNALGVCIGCANFCWVSSQLSPFPVGMKGSCNCAAIKASSGGGQECIFCGGEALPPSHDDPEYISTKRSMRVAAEQAEDIVQQSVLGEIMKGSATAAAGVNEMMSRIRGSMSTVEGYERKDYQDEALKVIPVKLLLQRAADRFTNKKNEAASYEDQVIRELLHWFKREFFKWVNSPNCATCNGATQAIGMGQPNEEERRNGAGRVEIYKCNKGCGGQTRFPRYNNPVVSSFNVNVLCVWSLRLIAVSS
jgi:hypothetical protein